MKGDLILCIIMDTQHAIVVVAVEEMEIVMVAVGYGQFLSLLLSYSSYSLDSDIEEISIFILIIPFFSTFYMCFLFA